MVRGRKGPGSVSVVEGEHLRDVGMGQFAHDLVSHGGGRAFEGHLIDIQTDAGRPAGRMGGFGVKTERDGVSGEEFRQRFVAGWGFGF